MNFVSLAKIRTQTGCLRCRQRRKKCDEARPQCIACTRNALQCSWPSNEKITDKRRITRVTSPSKYTGPTPSQLKIKPEIPSPGLCPPGLMPSPFQLEHHRYLYQYFGSTLLPNLVRQNSLSRYTDQTYMLRLALEFPPLMGSFISIAGMHLASLSSNSCSKWTVSRAVQSYVQTLVMLREALSQPCDFGSHDALLATVITLSVFETSRIDSTLRVAPHVTASGYLLGKRRVRWISPQATAVFDRICVESFVYHASLMMLFDPSLDYLSDSHCREDLSRCFSYSVHASPSQLSPSQALATQPILHTSYEFFLLIADATRLARIEDSLDRNQVCEWVSLQSQVERYASLMRWERDLCMRLYVLALQILLLKSTPDPRFCVVSDNIGHYAQEGRRIIPCIDQDRYFTSLLLWPLAVIGSVSLGDESAVIRDYISLLAVSRLGGQAVTVLRRLDKLWALSSVAEEETLPPCIRRSRGLQVLLDGEDDDKI